MVEVFVFLQIAYVLSHQNNINNFNNFRGLNSYAHESNPALITGAVVSSKRHQSQKEGYTDYKQNCPFIRDNIKIQNGKKNEEKYSDQYTEYLNKQVFERAAFIGLGGAANSDKAIYGAYHAKRKKHHVGALHKFNCMGFDFS